MTPFSSVAMLEKLALLKIAACKAAAFRRASSARLVAARRGDGHERRKAAAVLADVSQFIDVLDAARGLEDQGLKARRNGGFEFGAQGTRAGDYFSGSEISAGVILFTTSAAA